MLSRSTAALAACCFLTAVRFAPGQQAIAPGADSLTFAQTNAAIEQARLFRRPTGAASTNVDANGMALPDSDSSSSDDSFGEQLILKSQPRVRSFVISGDASIFYTDNVALARRGRIDDSFLVLHASGGWTRRLSHNLELQLAASAATFRYSETAELDFTNLSLGAGVSWAPQSLRGAALFARYDFIELLDRDGDEILRDHEFTVGIQKVFALGRGHAFTLGAAAMAGITDPYSAQRDQAGIFAGYRAQLTRSLETELFYRASVHFYNDDDRFDFNHVVSWTLRYRFTSWAEANAFLSYGANRSETSVFDYDVLTVGAGVGFAVRF